MISVSVFLLRRVGATVLAVTLSACNAGNNGVRVINASDSIYEVPARESGITVEPIAQANGRGPLILLGGGRISEALRKLITAYAGSAPRLCLIDSADDERAELYRLFDDFSGVRLTVLDLEAGDVARPDVIAALRSCTGYFFGGGAPQRLSTIMRPGGRDSFALIEIRRRFESDGALVAGASAGAMIAGPLTLCECGANSSVQAVMTGELFKAPGFDLLRQNVLIDAHFFERGLLGRHMFALARDRIPVGVGIDEDAAVLVPGDGGPWRVLNGGKVAIVRLPDGADIHDLSGFGYSVLYPGDRFDPVSGTIAVSSNRQPATAVFSATERADFTDESQSIRYEFLSIPETRRYVRDGTATVETILGRRVSVAPL